MSIERFPWPFTRDTYRYSANVEPAPRRHTTAVGHWGDTVLDVDEHYCDDLRERARVLHADPSRHTELAHMRPASWETLLVLLGELSSCWPDRFQFTGDEGRYRWVNHELDQRHDFTVGDEDVDPLAFAASQVQEDIALLDEREGELYLDAGVVTFASNWSLAFDIGMTFLDVHGPVPRTYADGAIVRAREFLLRLEPGQPYRRTNWSSSPSRRLDTALESYDQWGVERGLLLAPDSDLGADLSLRVEVQHLIRLPQSRAIVFLIRTYLLTMAELATVPQWSAQLRAVLAELPTDMLSYKGFLPLRDRLIDWLTTQAPTML